MDTNLLIRGSKAPNWHISVFTSSLLTTCVCSSLLGGTWLTRECGGKMFNLVNLYTNTAALLTCELHYVGLLNVSSV